MSQERLDLKPKEKPQLPSFWLDIKNLRKVARWKEGAFRTEDTVRLPDSREPVSFTPIGVWPLSSNLYLISYVTLQKISRWNPF